MLYGFMGGYSQVTGSFWIDPVMDSRKWGLGVVGSIVYLVFG